jgi:hypothetical protein
LWYVPLQLNSSTPCVVSHCCTLHCAVSPDDESTSEKLDVMLMVTGEVKFFTDSTA